jgi:eukaryotic-like serine/threonine-protein kinase
MTEDAGIVSGGAARRRDPLPSDPLGTSAVVDTPREPAQAARAALRAEPALDVSGQAKADRQEAASAPASASARYTGLVLDQRYVVEGLLARGGMGLVYQCRHRVIGKKLAIKIIRSELAALPEATPRFLLEAKAASAIGNEHIIDILDFGALPDGSAYLIMEYLDGVPLSELVRAEALPPVERVVGVAMQVAEALAAAHAAGIVHRDLKPDNIFLVRRKTEDFVKILDFGIAKMSEIGADRLTHTGTIVGTPHYMSPEQAAGLAIDQRADIYALGVILYELVSGQVPFDGSNFMAVLTQHLQAIPPAFQSRNPPVRVPAALEAIIFKCLAKQPEQRYPSMHEVHAALISLGREPRAGIPNAPNVPERISARPGPAPPSRTGAGMPGMTLVVGVAGAERAPVLGASGPRGRRAWLAASVLSIALALGWALSGTPQTHVAESAAAVPRATTAAPAVAPAQASPAAASPAAAPAEASPATALHVAPVADLTEPAAPVHGSAEPTSPPANALSSSARPRRKPRSITSAERRTTPPAQPAHGRQDLVNPWPER